MAIRDMGSSITGIKRVAANSQQMWSFVHEKANKQWSWRRPRIKRLVRCTMCFSTTECMHDLVIGLFINR
jgi:IS1 family transposase